jgi:hypothetical protein
VANVPFVGAGEDADFDELAQALDAAGRLAEYPPLDAPLLVVRLDHPPMPSRAVGVLAEIGATGRLVRAIRAPLRAWIYQADAERATLIVPLRRLPAVVADVWLGALTRAGGLGEAPPARYALVGRDAAPEAYGYAADDEEAERWEWLELAILSAPDVPALPVGSPLFRELHPSAFPSLYRLLGPAASPDDLSRLGHPGLAWLQLDGRAVRELARRGMLAPPETG